MSNCHYPPGPSDLEQDEPGRCWEKGLVRPATFGQLCLVLVLVRLTDRNKNHRFRFEQNPGPLADLGPSAELVLAVLRRLSRRVARPAVLRLGRSHH